MLSVSTTYKKQTVTSPGSGEGVSRYTLLHATAEYFPLCSHGPRPSPLPLRKGSLGHWGALKLATVQSSGTLVDSMFPPMENTGSHFSLSSL